MCISKYEPLDHVASRLRLPAYHVVLTMRSRAREEREREREEEREGEEEEDKKRERIYTLYLFQSRSLLHP